MVQVIRFGGVDLTLLYDLLLYIYCCYTVLNFQSHTNVFVEDLQSCCVEPLQHGNAHLANNVVNNFCW